MPEPSVVCVGTASLDTIAVVERMPAEDERIEAEEIVYAGGGPAATAAVTLSRLGIPAAFAGVVGRDRAGEAIVEGLASEGVDTTYLERDSQVVSAASLVLVSANSAARTIVTKTSPKPRIVPDTALWLHTDHVGYSAVRELTERSSMFSIDGGNPIPALFLEGVDLYAPTLKALLSRYPGHESKEALDAALAEGAKKVVATDGASGCLIGSEHDTDFVPGYSVETVSTLGAGDVFHGALLAALVEGREWREAAKFANACAALSCRGLDGRSRIPHYDEVMSLMNIENEELDSE